MEDVHGDRNVGISIDFEGTCNGLLEGRGKEKKRKGKKRKKEKKKERRSGWTKSPARGSYIVPFCRSTVT